MRREAGQTPPVVPLLLLALCLFAPAPVRGADRAQDAASRAAVGNSLFLAGNWHSALVEFRMAYELVPNHNYLFNMAQCEYHLGQLKEALAHYQKFVELSTAESQEKRRAKTDAVKLARMRIEAINQRPSVFNIGCAQDSVDVVIEGVASGGPTQITGQGPNDFQVPHGRYRITVSKAKYIAQTKDVEIGVAETKPLFFELRPVPARLEIRTQPASAILYVRGNRARNPYIQLVEPGSYEIYAEATDHLPRREVLNLGPGDVWTEPFALEYRQRSGRPELIGFWTAAGAVGVATGVLARLESLVDPTSVTVVAAGALVGGIAGGLTATALNPDYIPDNLALFRIGAMWIGGAEGAAIGFALAPPLKVPAGSAGWFGGAAGLTLGAFTGVLLDHRAPNYGRVALIQSGAAIGALMGALFVPAITPETGQLSAFFRKYGPLGVLGGLNLGLAAGLAIAYVPDPRTHGPSWRRVVLVDLAVAAGAITGALFNTVENCLSRPDDKGCRFASTRPTARVALAGAVVGLAAGWILTWNFDKDDSAPPARAPTAFVPLPAAVPVQDQAGRYQLLPGLATQGRF